MTTTDIVKLINDKKKLLLNLQEPQSCFDTFNIDTYVTYLKLHVHTLHGISSATRLIRPVVLKGVS